MKTQIVLTGILQLKVEEFADDLRFYDLADRLTNIPVAKLTEELHVTLVHQQFIAPYRSVISDMMPAVVAAIPVPDLVLGYKIHEIKREKRTSWIVLLRNQDAWRMYVNRFMAMVGLPIDPEPRRVYHISVANLTGSPFDSVGDVSVSDLA